MLGLGANVLISDEGIPGAVIRLSDEYWRQVNIERDEAAGVARVTVNAGTAQVGLEIDGALGSHVVVRDNQLLSCQIGVVLRSRAATPTPAMWRITDNIAPGAKPAVIAAAAAQVVNNLA